MSAAADTRFFRGSIPGRKGEILDAAVDVFGRKGYEAGSLREIAEIVGISEPAIYRHFGSKHDLFEHMLIATGDRIAAEVGPLVDSATASNVADILREIVAQREAAIPSYVPIIQTAMVAVVHNPEFLAAYRSAIIEPILVRVSTLVARLDSEFGLSHGPETLPARVHTLASVFVGYFVTSVFMADSDMPVADAILKIMGWDSGVRA